MPKQRNSFFDWNGIQVNLLCFGFVRKHLIDYNIQIDGFASIIYNSCATFDFDVIHSPYYSQVSTDISTNNDYVINCNFNLVPVDLTKAEEPKNYSKSYPAHNSSCVIFRPFISDLFKTYKFHITNKINNIVDENKKKNIDVIKLTIIQKCSECKFKVYPPNGYVIAAGVLSVPKTNLQFWKNGTDMETINSSIFLNKLEAFFSKIETFSSHSCLLDILPDAIRYKLNLPKYKNMERNKQYLNGENKSDIPLTDLVSNMQTRFIEFANTKICRCTCSYATSTRPRDDADDYYREFDHTEKLKDDYYLRPNSNDFVQVCIEFNKNLNQYYMYFTKGNDAKFETAKMVHPENDKHYLDFERYEYLFVMCSPRCGCAVADPAVKGFEYQVLLQYG